EPACPASTSVISSPSTSRYAWAPMSRTTCTFGRTSITVDARSRSLRQRVLGDAQPHDAASTCTGSWLVRSPRSFAGDGYPPPAALPKVAADRLRCVIGFADVAG